MVEPHKRNPNQRKPGESSISVITWGEEIKPQQVNAISNGKAKVDPEAKRRAMLKNLKKARAAKAKYRAEDQAEIARGEVPPSVLKKAATGMPIIVGEDKQIKPFDLKKGMWDSTVSIPLPQLLYHSPDIYHQFLGLIGAQPITTKKKVEALKAMEAMEVDSEDLITISMVNNVVSIDTSSLGGPVKLQAMLGIVGEMQLEFFIDGGAIVSVISLEVVEQLGETKNIQAINRTLKFGDGEVEPAVGTIKLTLILTPEVEVVHTFCVTKNIKTPLILGQDFIQGTNGIADSVSDSYVIRGENADYLIPTHDGDGISSEVLFPRGGEIVEDERLIIPITVTNSNNKKLKNVKIQYDYTMEPGESHLLWLSMSNDSKEWDTNMVLQPEEKIFSKLGLYMVPSLLSKGGEGPYCMVVMNFNDTKTTLKKGTLIGKLYNGDAVPNVVERIVDVNEITSVVHEQYLALAEENPEKEVLAPSLIVGPIFIPRYEKLEEAGVKVNKPRGSGAQQVDKVYSVYSIALGQETEMKFDINPELEKEKQESLKQVLLKHKQVFATSLKDVAELKAKPYKIKLKDDAKPVKVPPRTVPYEANKWFKGYICDICRV